MRNKNCLKLLTVDMDTIEGGGLVVRLYSSQDLLLRVEALLFVRIPIIREVEPTSGSERVSIQTGRWSAVCFTDKRLIKGHNKMHKGLSPHPPSPLLLHLFFSSLKESLKNAERFPGDTDGKLSEMLGGIELKGQLLTEIPPAAFGAM